MTAAFSLRKAAHITHNVNTKESTTTNIFRERKNLMFNMLSMNRNWNLKRKRQKFKDNLLTYSKSILQADCNLNRDGDNLLFSSIQFLKALL